MYFGRLSYVLGWMLLLLGAAQALPWLIALGQGESAARRIFELSMLLSAGVGTLLVLTFRGVHAVRDRRAAFLTPVAAGFICPLFCCVPFMLLGGLTFSEAMFEAISAITTSGGSVFAVTDNLPRSLLFWRALLSWLGALAFTIICLTVYRPLDVGGMGLMVNALPHGEGSGLLARMRGAFHPLLRVYALASLLVVLLLWATGESLMRATTLGLSAISTDGFSAYESGAFMAGGRPAEAILMLAMLIGAINMTYLWPIVRGRFSEIRSDPEVATGLLLPILFLPVVVLGLQSYLGNDLLTDLWNGLFLTVSAVTTTGLMPADVPLVPLPVALILMSLLAVGGMAGSSAGGLKLFRLSILARIALFELRRLSFPHRSQRIRHRQYSLEDKELGAIHLAVFGLLLTGAMGILVLSALGIPYEVSPFIAISALSNAAAMAPGLDPSFLGYWTLTPSQLWVVSAIMLAGRLEVALLMAMLVRNFWVR